MDLMSETDNIVADYFLGNKNFQETVDELWLQACKRTDKDVESLERVFKIARAGRCYTEDVELVNAWLTQWNEDPEYDIYKSSEVNLLVDGRMLFLIPKEERLTKPIRVIIAK